MKLRSRISRILAAAFGGAVFLTFSALPAAASVTLGTAPTNTVIAVPADVPTVPDAPPSWFATCPTAAGTGSSTSAPKVATIVPETTDFALTTGVRVAVKFTYNCSLTTTYLNVNDTGAKRVYRYGTTNPVTYMWYAGQVVDFVYDGTYWQMVRPPAATTSYEGTVKLSTSTNYGNTATAATPSAVRLVAITANDAAAAAAANASSITTISSYLAGEDAKVTFTNTTDRSWMPYLSFSVQTGSVWQTVWDEAAIAASNSLQITALSDAIDEKADRAWGYYDSHTGEYAPDGYTWISSPQIAIAGGLSYIETDGGIWVLCANGLVAQTTVDTNGYFRVSDGDGNTTFEIIKGSDRTVGANPTNLTTSVSSGITHVFLEYSIVAASHPTLYISDSLTNATWLAETATNCLANVVWSGSSGSWYAEVYGKTALDQLFIKGQYEISGETIINNAAPVQMEYIYLGGVKYQLGTATISGNTVLTLTEAL